MESGPRFLYEERETLSRWGGLPKSVPQSVAQNLNPCCELRLRQMDTTLLAYQNKLLGKNALYVNLSEIDDAQFKVSEEDKALNRKFYGE